MATDENAQADPVKVVKLLRGATRLDKCRVCGCFHSAVIMLEDETAALERWPELKEAHQKASQSLLPVQYNCNGCEYCIPVEALKALRGMS